MQYLSVALPLAAMVSGALATPWGAGSCANNACLAAVTGKAALGDGQIRASHCSSYLATTVTPIVTETVTITGTGKDNWKRATVAVCPNEVPNYASACDDAAYTSACSCFGYTEVKTTTIAPTTTTKTIWVKPTGGSGSCTTETATVTGTVTVVTGSTCPAGETSTKYIVTGTTSTATVTGTVTVVTGSTCPAGSTTTVTDTKTLPGGYGTATTVTITSTSTKVVNTGTVTATTVTDTKTVTVSGSPSTSSSASKCNVDDALATTLVYNFVDLLQFTSYAGSPQQGIPAGRGYHYNTSAATLATDFIDISDSINFMAGFPVSFCHGFNCHIV